MGYESLVEQGLAAYQASRPREARSLFERADALRSSARTKRALGICDMALDNYDAAHTELVAALRSRVDPLTDEQRADGPDGLKVVGPGLLAVAEEGLGGMSLVEVASEPAVVRRVSRGLDGVATLALVGAIAWLVETQGDHFWEPERVGADADKSFRLVEVQLDIP